ncbi:MAG: LOG family protein, partial [Terriglobales bacterium]
MAEANNSKQYVTIQELADFIARLQCGDLRNCVVQGIDVSSMCINWETVDTENALFLGCRFADIDEEIKLRRKGAHFFAPFVGLPYDPYRSKLYTPEELMQGYDAKADNSLDSRIERHFEEHGGHDADIVEALVQRIHDYSIDAAIKRLIGHDPATALPVRKPVGFMGGHLARRDSDHYRLTVTLARMVTRAGYFVVSGGGPGIMEAANLGAYLGGIADDTCVDRALQILCKVPCYADAAGVIDQGYVGQAMKVREAFPGGAESLAVPTWFYGHEPVNMFASHVGKYFSNSIREDGLLAISVFGVVFAPGSAATIEEVFIDAAQNHYGTFDYVSPMLFLGQNHYLQSQVYSCLAQQA